MNLGKELVQTRRFRTMVENLNTRFDETYQMNQILFDFGSDYDQSENKREPK